MIVRSTQPFPLFLLKKSIFEIDNMNQSFVAIFTTSP